jgi:hypothetical protein
MSSILRDDPEARAALQYALLLVGVVRTGENEAPAYEGPPVEPAMLLLAVAEVADVFAHRYEEAGGNPEAVLASIYLHVAGGETEEAGHG